MMIEYALINIETNEVLDRQKFEDQPDDVSHKGMRWLPLTIVRPALDSYQYVELDPITIVTETEVTITYPQRQLTEQERTTHRLNLIEVELFNKNPHIGNILLSLYNQTLVQQGLPIATKEQFIAFTDSLMQHPDLDPEP